jgi:hypothetical protein
MIDFGLKNPRESRYWTVSWDISSGVKCHFAVSDFGEKKYLLGNWG